MKRPYSLLKMVLIYLMTMIYVFSSPMGIIASEENDSAITGETLYGQLLDGKTTDNQTPAEGYDVLNGLWNVGAIDYDYNNNPNRNIIVDINDSDVISDMYDSIYLSFFSDGSFVYVNPFIHEGTYIPHPKNQGCYILKTDRTYRLAVENDEIVEVEVEGSKPSYYLELCDDTLHFQDYDAFTGQPKANDNGYYFVRLETESSFIQNNKADVQFKNPNEDTEVNSGAEGGTSISLSSYAGILEEYTEKMKKAAPQLINEYNNESTGISDINKLAELCNKKVGDLADICTEGVGKMTDLMLSNGDSYDIYDSWAQRLLENYNEIAQGIMDAYIDSAM